MTEKTKGRIRTMLIVSGVIIAIFVIAIIAVVADNRFSTVYSSEVVNTSGNVFEAEARVYASPAIKWEQANNKGLLVICLILIPVAGYIVASGALLKKKSPESDPKGTSSWLLNMIIYCSPIIGAAVFGISAYSASLSEGSLVTTVHNLKEKYGISDEQIQKLSSGERRYIKDETGALTTYFKQ